MRLILCFIFHSDISAYASYKLPTNFLDTQTLKILFCFILLHKSSSIQLSPTRWPKWPSQDTYPVCWTARLSICEGCGSSTAQSRTPSVPLLPLLSPEHSQPGGTLIWICPVWTSVFSYSSVDLISSYIDIFFNLCSGRVWIYPLFSFSQVKQCFTFAWQCSFGGFFFSGR